ncbi:putative serine esterase DUF676 [Homoserinimonas aerilata]|uniref:Putative serine esterase DUF676 n=1 Tax=Homoserinimonas aerilata TaxID=1162970 RepID=A0A542YJB8_9MICO|nr:alpha/beta hydrolase [Homoserinimonas aerilata]TQL48205.1 putative serine esterase DUF676 [Homoserinimonas aerilata]
MNPLVKAWWWSLDYLSAIGGQLRGAFLRVVPEAYARGDDSLPAVVLIPGVYERWGFLATLAGRLNARGHRIVVIEGLRDNRMPVRDGADEVAAAIAAHGPGRYVLVGHSKGGLIGKALLARAEADPAAAGLRGVELIGMVAIATPFAGSAYARYLPGRTLRGLAPADETIVALARAEAVNRRIVSVLPAFDPHIPGERTLGGGSTTVTLRASGHFRVLRQEATIAAVVEGIDSLGGGPSERPTTE